MCHGIALSRCRPRGGFAWYLAHEMQEARVAAYVKVRIIAEGVAAGLDLTLRDHSGSPGMKPTETPFSTHQGRSRATRSSRLTNWTSHPDRVLRCARRVSRLTTKLSPFG